jgi:class 3 adenylate cyclase
MGLIQRGSLTTGWRRAKICLFRPLRAWGVVAVPLGMTSHPTNLDEFRLAATSFLEKGEPLIAYDTISEGLLRFPGDVRLRQMLALALARSGASQPANSILVQLAGEGHLDEETLGLLARTHKDLWAASDNEQERRRHLHAAFEHYREAHNASGGCWSGINAATMALMLGDQPMATMLARQVRARCLEIRRSASNSEDGYWLLAMLGEAALILQEWSEARDWYEEAAVVGGQRWGDLASTRRNARLIFRHLGADSTRINAWLRIPPVVVFAGHLIDRADRVVPRFPSSIEPAVRMAIRERLQKIKPGFGYASAACGADILFLESLLEMNGELHIVLPYDRDEFREASVAIVPGTDWAARYDRLLGQAAEVVAASGQHIAGGVSYDYGAQLLDGMAAGHADDLDTELVCLAVWDGKPGGGPGGTATTVNHWRTAGRRIEIVDVSQMVPQSRPVPLALEPAVPPAAPEGTIPQAGSIPSPFRPQVVAMLFADVRGFSKLSEDEIPVFVEHFLGAVAKELVVLPRAPLLSNTWGDGLYFVFAGVQDAGRFALRICDVVEGTNWIARGFSHDLSLRIGLHAGPAYACVDPVTTRPNYVGVHVSRAARIEPITPPGQVYASDAFAALACAEQVQEFRCSYVGQMSQAKGYGVFPTYVVQRRRPEVQPGESHS